MQRLFFHNEYDKSSRELFEQYTDDPTITIYNVHGADKNNLPKNIRLSYLPYLIDKEFVLTTTGPYTTGIITVNIECRDYQGNVITTEKGLQETLINDEAWLLPVANGVISFELNCVESMDVTIEIYKREYVPFQLTIQVVAE